MKKWFKDYLIRLLVWLAAPTEKVTRNLSVVKLRSGGVITQANLCFGSFIHKEKEIKHYEIRIHYKTGSTILANNWEEFQFDTIEHANAEYRLVTKFVGRIIA